MKTWIFYPPLKGMSGGCMVLLQIARQLQSLGRLGGILYWDEPPGVAEYAELPWVRAGDAAMAAGDAFVVPEGWPNALVLGLRRGCRTLVYCQNWSYLFHGLEQGVRWRTCLWSFWPYPTPWPGTWSRCWAGGRRSSVRLWTPVFSIPRFEAGRIAAHRLHAA